MSARRNREIRVLREALVQIFAQQLRFGVSVEDTYRLARSCVQAAAQTALERSAGANDKEGERIGSILRSWHRQTRYLTSDGFPRHLGIEGKNGLRNLINAYYPRSQFDMVLRSLKASGLVRRDNGGRWYPTTKYAVFPSLTPELLLHFSQGVARFIETLTRNVSTLNKEEALFERSSTVRNLPVSAEPEFRAFVHKQALAFLESVDDWLEGRVEEGKRSRGKKCTAGVFTFAFIDELALRNSSVA